MQRYLHPCWLMLMIGLLCGSLSTWLYLGWQGAEVGMGQGLKTLLHVTPPAPSNAANKNTNKTLPTAPKYDFYTRLLRKTPMLKRQLPTPKLNKPAKKSKPITTGTTKSAAKKTPQPSQSSRFKPGTYYMLQAGAYPGFAEADKLRARLALTGLESHIEKVSIRGKGYYRVRLGPYYNNTNLQRVREQLRGMNIAAEQIQRRRSGTKTTSNKPR